MNSTYIENNPCNALVLPEKLHLKVLNHFPLLDQPEQFGAAFGIDIDLPGYIAYLIQ